MAKFAYGFLSSLAMRLMQNWPMSNSIEYFYNLVYKFLLYDSLGMWNIPYNSQRTNFVFNPSTTLLV
jgi:hypothetical protein